MDRHSYVNKIDDSSVRIRALEAHLFMFEPGRTRHCCGRVLHQTGKQLRGEEDMNSE